MVANSKEKTSGYYDQLRKNEWKETASVGPSSLSRYRIIVKLLKKHNFQGDLLDIGCGTGTLLMQIQKKMHFQHVEGSDFSQEALKLSKEKADFVFQADLNNIESFNDKTYDSIVCSEVLEHIDNDSLAIQNLRTLLKFNGKVLITVPYSEKYWSEHDDFSGHVRRYQLDELLNKFENAGFENVEYFIWGGAFYSLYHNFLMKTHPQKIMNTKSTQKPIKKMIGKMLYYLFFVDDLFLFMKRGRRIFLVAQVNNKS
jgi:ubiquinone/menaquinone biosynthesis C-methylase UbiE